MAALPLDPGRACAAGRRPPPAPDRPGPRRIGLGEVRDVLRNYLAIDTYERLVLIQGWPRERYSRWLTHAITSAICP